MMIEDVRKEHELVDLFCNLAEVPSPSLHEEKVAEWIKNYCDKNGLDCKFDDFKNVVINLPATDNKKDPLMLSAHMDVIGDDSPVKTYLDENGLFTQLKEPLAVMTKQELQMHFISPKISQNQIYNMAD